jgi:hypothetical protein
VRILTSKGGEAYQASYVRKVWKHQRGNQNQYIEEEQTTEKDKRKSTKGQTTIYESYIYISNVNSPNYKQ